MYEPKLIFDSTPYVQVPHSRKIALRCYACGRTVIMNASNCDGRCCPLCGGALLPIGYVARARRVFGGAPELNDHGEEEPPHD